jgi:hypothetical protein
MQRTSSCRQLENLRKITPPLNPSSEAGSSLKNLASKLGNCLFRNSGTSVVVSSGLAVHRNKMLPQGKLQLGRLNELSENYKRRERTLDPENNLSLFNWPSVKPPAGAFEEGANMQFSVPKPLGNAKLVLANLYAKKYGISIVCQFEGNDEASVVDSLIAQVRNAQGRPVGFIVPAKPPGVWPAKFNYRGHVVPLIIQQTDVGFDVVNLDSLADNAKHYQQFLNVLQTRMNACDAGVLRHSLVNTRRQSDRQSCHTDALQILKDALCAVKSNPELNCFDLLGCESERFHLPSFLQKTNQRSRALAEDNFQPASLLMPERQGHLWGEKSISIGQHRNKYTAEFGARKSNYFLAVKAFYNAGKVLEQLEKESSAGTAKSKF